MPDAKVPWSFTAASDPQRTAEEVVVCSLSLAKLGIDELAAEADDWYRARAQEYGSRLLDALRTQLPLAEVIVHIDDAEPADRVQVVLSAAARAVDRERELRDRVDAIQKRTWLQWQRSLHSPTGSARGLAGSPPRRARR